MRKLFPGHFRPTKAEFDELWETAVIVPDSNILLHMLRYGEETRQQVFRTLQAFKPRLWVPNRVAFEFLRRWRDVDSTNRGAYSKLKEDLGKQGRALANLFDPFTRHQTIDTEAEKAKVDSFIKDLYASLDAAEKSHPTIEEAESVVSEIADLVGDEIGADPTEEQNLRWIKEATERYKARIPPGYMDANKDDSDKFGDYFIWQEMIEIAKSRSKPVIFVSDDRKEDWILRHDGRDIGPRPELVKEFYDRTKFRFYAYPFRAFLERSKEYVGVEVSDHAIAEIEAEEQRASREQEIKESESLDEILIGIKQPSAGTAITPLTLGLDYHTALELAKRDLLGVPPNLVRDILKANMLSDISTHLTANALSKFLSGGVDRDVLKALARPSNPAAGPAKTGDEVSAEGDGNINLGNENQAQVLLNDENDKGA